VIFFQNSYVVRGVCVCAAAFALLYGPGNGVQKVYAEDRQDNENSSEKIASGVFIENMDMSGKTYAEAETIVETYVQKLSQKTVRCYDEELSFSMTLAEAGFCADTDSVMAEAFAVGREGGFFERISDQWHARHDGVYLTLHFTCDRGVLEEALMGRTGEVHKAPVEASIVRQNGQFIVSESQNGRALNAAKMTDAIVSAVENGWNRADIPVPLIVDETEPAHTTAQLQAIQDLLGSYATSFAGSSGNRAGNIKNGAAKLENHVVYPGEEFSFLSLMAPFSAANGYYMAGTYVNGRNVDGMGGGICQVSSTLYNAVLRAELTVTQRSNHMMTVGYVPLGADATIATPNVDFRFVNDMASPVLIEAYTYGTTLYVNIYGAETRPAGREISFVTVTEQVIAPGKDVITYDASLPEGYREITQKAHTGYVAAFYKNVYVNGELESQTLVSRSRYGAYPNYVTQGSGK